MACILVYLGIYFFICYSFPHFVVLYKEKSCNPGANPIVSYNSAVFIYSSTNSLACFENKNIFFHFEKTLHPTTTLAL
jgi:hypothetical protein